MIIYTVDFDYSVRE